MRLIIFTLIFSLTACAPIIHSFSYLPISKQHIIQCQYEKALDRLHQLTVTGNPIQKQAAFEFMGVIYSEKSDLSAFNHTLERFLFSRAGRNQNRQAVIRQWHKSQKSIRKMRLNQHGKAECFHPNDKARTPTQTYKENVTSTRN